MVAHAGEGPSIEGLRALGNSKSMISPRVQFCSSSNGGPGHLAEVQQAVVYSSLEDFSSRVEIYKGRHSLVWNCVCKHSKSPIILKGYVKAKMTERNFHQVRREIRLMQQINYDGCVRLLGHFEDDTVIYIVQEICAKGDLFKKLIRNGGMLDDRYVAGQFKLGDFGLAIDATLERRYVALGATYSLMQSALEPHCILLG
eukprot:gene2763-3057_t